MGGTGVSLFGGKRRDGDPDPESASPIERTFGAAGPGPATPGISKVSGPGAEKRPMRGEAMANIGKSISIKGDLTGEEDVLVEGKVEGKVNLPNNELTIGANGRVDADVHAKTVLVIGRVSGNVSGAERVEIQASGIVEGDVRAPRLVVQEGAQLNGSIQMTSEKPGALAKPSTTAQPKPAPGIGAEPRPPAPLA
jgi:cytoskeletal protein CcmA (bactofilin family)